MKKITCVHIPSASLSKNIQGDKTIGIHDMTLLLPTDFDAQIEGYTFFSRARTGKQGGGVAILARDDICKNIIPHISDRNIEMIWVSYKTKKCSPLFIGCYYGKQETRCSKEEITTEMESLSEEIQENMNEG